MIIDSPVRAEDPVLPERAAPTSSRRKTYDDPEILTGAFRTIPSSALPALRQGARRPELLTLLDDGCWGWKFDPTIFSISPPHR